MAVSPPPAPSSIDLSGLPPRVVEAAARVLALCREELRSEPRPEAPEEVELRVREATNEFARDVMGAVIENRDDGASRIERDGQSWFRVAVTPKTMSTAAARAGHRRCRSTRANAAGGRSTLSMHECWESLGPETLGSIRMRPGEDGREGCLCVAHIRRARPEMGYRLLACLRTSANRVRPCRSILRHDLMVPLRPGEDGRAKAFRCGTVSFHDAEGKRLNLSRPHAGERQAHAEGAACKRSSKIGCILVVILTAFRPRRN